jgi:hypothetical protein
MGNWLLIGPQKHWEIAFSHVPAIWGLTRRYYTTYSLMGPGDVLFFYSTAPIKGLVGYGILKDKVDAAAEYGRELIWPVEKKKGVPEWELRFTFTGKIMPHGTWNRVAVRVYLPFYQTSILELGETEAFRYKTQLDGTQQLLPLTGQLYQGINFPQNVPLIGEPEPALHDNLKQKIFDIGQIQNYYPKLEYPLAHGGRIDVVWQYAEHGVPAFAFEVELSNNFEKAIVRLKSAFLNWNTRPRLIAEVKFKEKIDRILSYEETKFRQSVKILPVAQLEQFYKAKVAFKEQEKNLGFSD